MAPGDLPQYSASAEAFAATMASIAATRGDAASVALLAYSKPELRFSDSRSDYGEDYLYFTLRLFLSTELYGRLYDEREALSNRLADLAREISSAHDSYAVVSHVALAPLMNEAEGWRIDAQKFLRGEGINNQGRVRSDNIAARVHDGLLFRSQPEINLYNALKRLGVYLAPLPVFLKGGATYQRLEPDFVLIHGGVLLVVEVDGSTVHRETPAAAHERTVGLQREGVHIERVSADACATAESAESCAAELMRALRRYSGLRG